MDELKRTVFHDQHLMAGATLVKFGGWEMPLMYPSGIVQEHLKTRNQAGLFDISHMGRFIVRGEGALAFLQHVLTNNAEALEVGRAQYTLIANETGGALDDAYLYRRGEWDYLLVVNAANTVKDGSYLQGHMGGFRDVSLTDVTHAMGMLALQGPASREILEALVTPEGLPEPARNALRIIPSSMGEIMISRTGYTGEPLGFELFFQTERGPDLWEVLVSRGAAPVGLGARDTLRLEAGLPLYGHELGMDAEGREIPIMAIPLARFAVSFSAYKGEFIGHSALKEQFEVLKHISRRDFSRMGGLPRRIHPVALTEKGIAREGARVFQGDRHVGYITSGTMVPFWNSEGKGLSFRQTDQYSLRAIGMAYLDSPIDPGERIVVEVRGKGLEGVVVPYHLRSDAPPFARPILQRVPEDQQGTIPPDRTQKIRTLLEKTFQNTLWRQKECVNLIPSEMTSSPMVRLLSIMDPAFRYAEHRRMKAFNLEEIFYYQGTDFIAEVELLLEQELRDYLGCQQVEARLLSGQMANATVFGAMVNFLNRSEVRAEPRRIQRVMNHSISRGGHLSAQPMGALRDFVAYDPRTERPAVLNFPTMEENPYRTDVVKTCQMIHEVRPQLLIFGKSMVLHPEPIAHIRRFLNQEDIGAVLMFDAAHVLGLLGPHFQQPFKEGADILTASTHKTFFGTQRGIVAADVEESGLLYPLWDSVVQRAFPGSVSNHHLGTLLGLLMATYEMNHFKDSYQCKVISNAKAFARALNDNGLSVAGDPTLDFTETHQVILLVGYGRGPEAAKRLEENNIICNFQATPDEEGFTAAGALRLGVAEMTRFGMGEEDFARAASWIADVLIKQAKVRDEVRAFRRRFSEMQYCFQDDEFSALFQRLHDLL